MTKCPHCGADLELVGTDCPRCGKSLLGEAEWVRTQKLWRHSISPGQTATQSIRPRDLADGVPPGHPIKLRKVGAATTADADCDYQLLTLLGQGGMGLVYQARQTAVSRSIALKMMKRGQTSGDQRPELFLAEALVTGHLDHPNIVPIYDLGMDEAGHLFYAMKELKGFPWSNSIGHKSIPENLEILLRVCDAVAFAHSRGVIHRDLKPQNVMLGDYGEVVLMDWGLAAATAAGSPALRISNNTALCGTPAYMAPEMAQGLGERIGPPSDVYLLGAILFEILAGFPPHLTAHDDPMDALTAAARNKIAAIEVPGELPDIARRAMATDPADRFGSVKDFQAAIRVYREHQESERLAAAARQKLDAARDSKRYDDYAEALFGYRQALRLWPENQAARLGLNLAARHYAKTAMDQGDLDLALSLLDETDEEQRKLGEQVRQRAQERARQTARIRALRRSLASAGAVVLALAAVSAYWINQERIRALRGEQTAQRALAESQRLLSESLESAAGDRAAIGQDAEALALLAAALRQNPSNRVAASRALDLLNRKDWSMPVFDASCVGLADKQLFRPRPPAPFPKRNVAVTQLDDRSVLLQVETTNQPPIPLDPPIGPLASRSTAQSTAVVSPDGRFVAFAAGDRRLHVHDRYKNADVLPPIALTASPLTLDFSPAGNLLAYGLRSGLFRFIDVVAGCAVRRNVFGPPDCRGHFLANRALFAMQTSATNPLCLVDLRTGNARTIRMQPGGHVETARFAPDGRGVVLSGGYGTAGIYSFETGEIQVGPVQLGGRCRMSAFSPDGQRCASATDKGGIVLWSLADGAELARVQAHSGPVSALAFDPQGRFLASGADDHRIGLWDARTLASITNFAVDDTVRSLAASASAKFLLAGVGHAAMLWNLEDAGTPPREIGRGGWVRAVDMHPDGKRALWADYDRGHVFELETGAEIGAGGKHTEAIWQAKFSPDGQAFATVSFDGYLRLWSLSGEPLTSFLQIHDGVAGNARTLAFSADGRWVAAGAGMGTVRIWDAATGREIMEPLRVASDQISAIDISPDNKRIALASWDGTATIQELIPCEETPPWLPDLAEAIGGCRATGSGYDPLTWSNRIEILSALQKETKASSDHPAANDWLRWFLAPRGTRTAGPWSTVTVPQTVARLLKSSAPEDIADAVAMNPNNPDGCLRMAETALPVDSARAAFWAASARQLNPAIQLPLSLEAVLARAPFDAADPPGPEAIHLHLGEGMDYGPYAYRDVVLHGTVDFLATDVGHSKLFFKETGPGLYGFIRQRHVSVLGKALGGNLQAAVSGRPIRLRGVLTPFQNDWEIQIEDAAQIQIDQPPPAAD